jgi:A/G-specific adenine glycosylase
VSPLQATLLAWFARARRDLPWRRTRDPWAVLVSEVMLQQTQVARVEPRYAEFLARFPNPAACAAVGAGEVIQLWAGLGYNRRALQLHRTAVVVAERHGGRLPDALADLLALPGVGPYTARAVLAFAHERDVAVLDANARRALSRLVGRTAGQREADALVPRGQGWGWNQAVLDLGATRCRVRPRCSDCPMAAHCAWRRAGPGAPDPWRPGPRQSRFEGSDRQGRGRLLSAVRRAPVSADDVAAAAGWAHQPERSRRVAAGLVTEGLLVEDAGGGLRLP